MGIKSYMKILSLFIVLGLLCVTAAAQASNSTGNRIWDENANQNFTYIWTPQTYSGFYYDLDTGEGSENMIVQLIAGSRTIEEKDLQYAPNKIGVTYWVESPIEDTYKWTSEITIKKYHLAAVPGAFFLFRKDRRIVKSSMLRLGLGAIDPKTRFWEALESLEKALRVS